MVGFLDKKLNSVFRNADTFPISLTSFMVYCNTDKQPIGLTASGPYGVDQAYYSGDFSLNTKYTLMIDYNNDIPYYRFNTMGNGSLFIFYISSNYNPQLMIKTKLDFFDGMNYDSISSDSCCYIDSICIPYWNASYSDGFKSIIKPLMLIPTVLSDVFFNNKNFNFIFAFMDEYLVINYIIGTNVYNVIMFDPDKLNYSQSFTVSFPYQLNIYNFESISNW